MKISTRVFAGICAVSAIFIILILLLIFQYSKSVHLATEYSQEIDPARQSMEHLLTTIYSDFLLVEEYLLVDKYTDLEKFDQLLADSQHQCDLLTEAVDDLILLEVISDKEVIKSYKTALVIYGSWERSRDALLQLKRQSLATDNTFSNEIEQEHERFITLMQNSTNYFTSSIQGLNNKSTEKQLQLSKQTNIVQILLGILFFSFIILIGFGTYLLIHNISKPLDAMRKASASFTKGNYATRIKHKSAIKEVTALEQQLNNVYELIDKTFTKKQKATATKKLLPPQFKEILDYIRTEHEKGKSPTFTDIKKNFKLTHPTVVSRVTYLEENGYINIQKEGRNKCVYESFH